MSSQFAHRDAFPGSNTDHIDDESTAACIFLIEIDAYRMSPAATVIATALELIDIGHLSLDSFQVSSTCTQYGDVCAGFVKFTRAMGFPYNARRAH